MVEYGRNSKTIKILNENLLLSEREALDVITLGAFSKRQVKGFTMSVLIFEAAIVIYDGLLINIRRLKWYQIRNQIVFRWKIRQSYILKKLSCSEILAYARSVYDLEGLDLDEKKNSVDNLIQN